jgi:hypothetical protein
MTIDRLTGSAFHLQHYLNIQSNTDGSLYALIFSNLIEVKQPW